MNRLFILSTFVFAIFAGLATAESIRHGALLLEDARVKAVMPGAPVTAAYVKITNTGSAADHLLGAESPIAGRIEIHRMEMQGDVMRMRPLDGPLLIPAGESVTLEPGGLHLMLMDLVTRKKAGETASLSLLFEDAGKIQLDVPVMAMGHGH